MYKKTLIALKNFERQMRVIENALLKAQKDGKKTINLKAETEAEPDEDDSDNGDEKIKDKE